MQWEFKSTDALLIVQFGANNDYMVPGGIWSEKMESKKDSAERRVVNKVNSQNNTLFSGEISQEKAGKMEVEKPEKVSLAKLPIMLWKSDYEMVKAVYQARRDQRDPNKQYHMVRFSFVRKGLVNREDPEIKNFMGYRGLMLSGFQDIANTSIWNKVRLYRNPLEDQPGLTMISLNFDAREPLFEYPGVLCQECKPNAKPSWEIIMRNNALGIEKS